jgi:hypothetical protein
VSVVDTIAGIVKPWADFYSHNKAVSVGTTWVHIAALVVGGGTAIASDRIVLKSGRLDTDARRRLLSEFTQVHRPVIFALAVSAISGLAMLLSDIPTFLVSPVYWTKMGLLVLLLANGYGIQLTEQKLALDPSPTNRLWKRFSYGAIASITLWLSVSLAGVILVND